MKPKLDRSTFEFSQEGNCNGSTDDIEFLTIECESSLGIDNDAGCYYVLKSEKGWSIDSTKDLQDLFDRIKKTITNN
jgi:hypothetical protein